MFPNNKSLNELVELLDFAFTTIDALRSAKTNDGVIDFKDFPLVFPILMSATSAFNGIDEIPQAWLNSTAEERAQILAHFASRFDLDNDVLEAKIEKLLTASVAIADVFLNLK